MTAITGQEQPHDIMSEEQGRNETPAKGASLQHGMSLRQKGFWLLFLFVIFTITTGLIIVREQNILQHAVHQLQVVHGLQEGQLAVNMAVARTILVVNENNDQAESATVRRRIAVEVEGVLSLLRGLSALYPRIAMSMRALEINLAKLNDPSSRLTYSEVRDNLHKLVIELGNITEHNRNSEAYWLMQYAETSDRLSLEWILFAFVGVAVLGSLVMIFVTRLAWDIRRVQDRAIQIVEGYRGEPLAVTRSDELGTLMESVNKMQLELRQRELQVELSRQQQFHKEKMVAVGTLASAVAHEINNPLSAIVGLAQSMVEQRAELKCGERRAGCHPDILQTQARRVMDITRQISEFSAPRSAEAELLDLNGLVRNTVRFVSFDRRFRTIDMVLNLDTQLPAVHAVGDHISQVLINLLINAADAAEDRTEPKPRIVVTTQVRDNAVVMMVADNGPGMGAAVLSRVFEEFFTTKPPGKGSGIGLAVSKSLIVAAGGSIHIDSEPGDGTTVTVELPVPVTVA